MRILVILIPLATLAVATPAIAQVDVSQAKNHAVVWLSRPTTPDGKIYIEQDAWTRIVFGAWDAFKRSGIDRVHLAGTWRPGGNRQYFNVRVKLVPGYKPNGKDDRCALADAYPVESESTILDRGTIRFYIGCSIERAEKEPVKGTRAWETAMSAILAHEIVHIIAPACKHGSDSSKIFGEEVNLMKLANNPVLSERVVTECFGED